MPDVALASSSLSALHLGTGGLDDQALGSLEGLEDLEGTHMSLDLGDGSHHQVSRVSQRYLSGHSFFHVSDRLP